MQQSKEKLTNCRTAFVFKSARLQITDSPFPFYHSPIGVRLRRAPSKGFPSSFTSIINEGISAVVICFASVLKGKLTFTRTGFTARNSGFNTLKLLGFIIFKTVFVTFPSRLSTNVICLTKVFGIFILLLTAGITSLRLDITSHFCKEKDVWLRICYKLSSDNKQCMEAVEDAYYVFFFSKATAKMVR